MSTPDPIAEDLAQIRLLQAAYNLNGDRLRLEALADTFARDGVLETPTTVYRGHDAIRTGLGGARPSTASQADPGATRHTFTRHHLTTSDLQPTGPDTAAGRTYFMVYTDIGLDHIGFYDDELVRADGVWRFSRRRVRIDWVSERTLTPSLLAAHRQRKDALK